MASKRKKSGKIKNVIIAFFLLVIVGLTVVFTQNKQDFRQRAATSNPTHPTGTYTEWNWPNSATGFNSFEWQVTVLADPTPAGYFWAHQFGFINGDGGYLGLQSQGNRRADGSIGKLAIFSLWNTTLSQGAACGNFSGEGVGQSCSIAYNWIKNRTYKLRVNKDFSQSTGTWWSAWVQDTVTRQDSFIGRIRVPAAWRGLSTFSGMWTENFVPAFTNCESLVYSSVRFDYPKANGGTISPMSHNNHLGTPGGCPGSSVTDVPNGVRQDMGKK